MEGRAGRKTVRTNRQEDKRIDREKQIQRLGDSHKATEIIQVRGTCPQPRAEGGEERERRGAGLQQLIG
jgi:hypothetical protein